jgi:RNA polymerase-binding transcription factor DksA
MPVEEIPDARSGTIVVMSDFDNESVSNIETTLNNVDRALERLRVGAYRTCQVCATPIDESDLVAAPLLAHCPAHPELA